MVTTHPTKSIEILHVFDIKSVNIEHQKTSRNLYNIVGQGKIFFKEMVLTKILVTVKPENVKNVWEDKQKYRIYGSNKCWEDKNLDLLLISKGEKKAPCSYRKF